MTKKNFARLQNFTEFGKLMPSLEILLKNEFLPGELHCFLD
jgi:hypothetical protein